MSQPDRQPLAAYPHVNTFKGAAAFPATDDPALDALLHAKTEQEVRFVVTLIERYLGTNAGRTLLLGVINTLDPEYIRAIVRDENAKTPVKPHVHRAKAATIWLRERVPSLLTGAIGVLIGLVVGWILMARHITVGAGAGFSHTAATVATFVVTAAILGAAGWAIGRRIEQRHTLNIELEFESFDQTLPVTTTHTHA